MEWPAARPVHGPPGAAKAVKLMCCSPCCLCWKRCCTRQRETVSAAAEYTVTYRYRYVDVPMQTYYGPGYSARDVLENMADSLETIAQRMT